MKKNVVTRAAGEFDLPWPWIELYAAKGEILVCADCIHTKSGYNLTMVGLPVVAGNMPGEPPAHGSLYDVCAVGLRYANEYKWE